MGAFARMNEKYDKGEIVLFPFPFTDLSQRKLRPCLIISRDMDDDIILCQITSKYSPNDEFSVSLRKNETTNGSLLIDSNIRTNMIFTASKNQIKKKLCKIKQDKYSKVISKIVQIIKN
jgi:mRNA interferase MazF